MREERARLKSEGCSTRGGGGGEVCWSRSCELHE
jgi:hypothetical protein